MYPPAPRTTTHSPTPRREPTPAPLACYFAAICAATTAPTSASVTTLPSGLVFDGTYTCASGPTGLRIIVDTWPTAARALYYPVVGSSVTRCSGVFSLSGSWSSAAQTWTLTPGAAIQNTCNTGLIGFSGRVELSGVGLLFSGTASGASTCPQFSTSQLTATAGRALPTGCAGQATIRSHCGVNFHAKISIRSFL